MELAALVKPVLIVRLIAGFVLLVLMVLAMARKLALPARRIAGPAVAMPLLPPLMLFLLMAIQQIFQQHVIIL
jgi:uncharacterized membrane protein